MAKRTTKPEASTVGIRMLQRDILALERIAKAEDRPLSTQMRKILTDFLREHERKEPAR